MVRFTAIDSHDSWLMVGISSRFFSIWWLSKASISTASQPTTHNIPTTCPRTYTDIFPSVESFRERSSMRETTPTTKKKLTQVHWKNTKQWNERAQSNNKSSHTLLLLFLFNSFVARIDPRRQRRRTNQIGGATVEAKKRVPPLLPVSGAVHF